MPPSCSNIGLGELLVKATLANSIIPITNVRQALTYYRQALSEPHARSALAVLAGLAADAECNMGYHSCGLDARLCCLIHAITGTGMKGFRVML